MLNNSPIGVFDSGVGGLTVVREIMRQLPSEDIIYFGDTARVPYGSKSKETVIRYSKQIVSFLQSNNVKTIVVACNTASAFALEAIKKDINIPVIDVVRPGAKVAAETTKNGVIGIIGTEGTINSRVYNEYIISRNKNLNVIGKACPLFVPLVEEGFINDHVTDEIASRYLNDLIKMNIDTLVLGCTHYPILIETISKLVGKDVSLVNPASETTNALKELLSENQMLNHSHQGTYKFFVSDSAEKFKNLSSTILSYDVEDVTSVKLE